MDNSLPKPEKPINVNDTDGSGDITPQEVAHQIAGRVDDHTSLQPDKSDHDSDGAFVNIQESGASGQSADVVVEDTNGNYVDITLIKLTFTDSDGNRFDQRTQIDNTTLVEKYDPDGNPLGTDSIDVDNRILRVGQDDPDDSGSETGEDNDVIPEEDSSLDLATPKQADWMSDGVFHEGGLKSDT